MRHEDAGSLLLDAHALYGSLVGHTLDERASFEAVAEYADTEDAAARTHCSLPALQHALEGSLPPEALV